MGAWGSGLYSNDTTCDIRDMYMDFLKEKQLSNKEAYEKMMELYDREGYAGDEDYEPLFWFALADTQWDVGKLLPEVKAKALEWIDKGGGLPLWEESGDGADWKMTLEKLRNKLETEQPKEKKIRKPMKVNQNLWNIGDVYAYRFHASDSKRYEAFGKYMILQKIAEEAGSSDDELIMRVHVFDRLFDGVPTIEDVKGIRLLPLDFPNSKQSLDMNSRMRLDKRKDYPASHLTYIGNMPIPTNVVQRHRLNTDSWWDSIEGWSRYFPLWQGLVYEEIEEGVFKYTHHDMPQKEVVHKRPFEEFYFGSISRIPPEVSFVEFKDYKGEERIGVGCTQLDSHHAYFRRSKSDLKCILNEWLCFLSSETKMLKSLHYNTRVTQEMVSAACCQINLEELRFKWGSYSDLSSLKNLQKLKFLYIGEGASVQDITILGEMKNLVVLNIKGFKKIEDFSVLAKLSNLEQLVLLGPGAIKDLEFLREMSSLRTILVGNLKFRKKYTSAEIADLRAALPNLIDIGNCLDKL